MIARMRALAYLALAISITAALTAFGACDSRVRGTEASSRPEQRSKELETCSASVQCAEELRCFDGVCRRTSRSTVGDYFAALGAQKRAAGELEAAIDSYNRALGHYDSEKLALPPDVDCAYGSALVAARANKEHAELGARVLHRCLLAVPVGSALRDHALADLALLADAGLDPAALGRTALADVYLTKMPAPPAADKLVIDVKANPPVTAKSFQAIPDKLAEPELHTALVACWQGYNAATHKDTLVATVGVKVVATPSEYEDEGPSYTTKIDPPATLTGADQAADQCVHAAVDPAIKDLKALRDVFQTKLVITIK